MFRVSDCDTKGESRPSVFTSWLYDNISKYKYRMVNISNTKWSTPHQSNEIIFHPVDKIQTSKYGIIV